MNVQAPILALIALDLQSSTLIGSRVYPALLPESADMPAAVVSIVGNTPSPTHDGPSKIDLVRAQVTAYGRTYGQAANAAELIRRAIDGHRGDIEHMGFIYPVDGIKYLDSRDGYLENVDPVIFYFSDEYQVRLNREYNIGSLPNQNGGLQFFADDEQAISSGLQVGDWYLLSWGNSYGVPGDMPKKVSQQ